MTLLMPSESTDTRPLPTERGAARPETTSFPESQELTSAFLSPRCRTTNSTYIFNIGYNVPAGLIPGECSTTTAAQAYQVTSNGGSKVCYRLSTDISKPRTLVGQNLYDQANPARGWQLTYPGGDICPQTGVSRTFTLVFMCDRNQPFPLPNGTMYQEFIDETSDCNYMAFSYSQAGCPLGAFAPPPARRCSSALVWGCGRRMWLRAVADGCR